MKDYTISQFLEKINNEEEDILISTDEVFILTKKLDLTKSEIHSIIEFLDNFDKEFKNRKLKNKCYLI
jgi:hypothetical protein